MSTGMSASLRLRLHCAGADYFLSRSSLSSISTSVETPTSIAVTSSCLCKNLEGAGFPFQVKAIENGIDNSVHAFHVHKADHWPRPSSHLHKATLDNIGSAQLLPEMFGKTEKC